jgi:hypothetical protein
VKSTRPSDATKGLIPIGGPKYTSPPPATGLAKPVEEYWMDYYKSHDEKEGAQGIEELREKITVMSSSKKWRDVNAVLVGFLKHRGYRAEPWMYEALGLSIKMMNGSEKDVKTALGYAADLAVKTHNPNHLVSVADQLYLLGYYDRVGKLLDEAAELVPHRGEPLVMSINLALKTKDPKRMARSIGLLLSQGWPGIDERIRSDAHKQAEVLAKTLREEDRTAEAEALLESLPESEARDLYVRLRWVGDAGLALSVDEPLGATANIITPRTVFGGSIVKDGYGKHPEEVYVCPRAFDGEYIIHVDVDYNNEKKPATQATLEIITHEGTPQEHKEIKKINLEKKLEPVKVTITGGRRKKALPYVAPTSVTQTPAPRSADSSKSSSTTPADSKTQPVKPTTKANAKDSKAERR